MIDITKQYKTGVGFSHIWMWDAENRHYRCAICKGVSRVQTYAKTCISSLKTPLKKK